MEKFFGRKDEIEKLSDSFADVQSGERKNVLIYGYSGVGKTTLVNQFSMEAEKSGAMLVFGKADTLHTQTPYSSIVSALGMFIKKAISENPDIIDIMKRRILEKLEDNIYYALVLIPELGYLFKEMPDSDYSKMEDDEHFTKHLLLSLLEAFGSVRSPLILFLDDLQWMDSASYEFLINYTHLTSPSKEKE